MNDAVATLNETVEDTQIYKEQITSLNRNLTSLNGVYGNVLGAFKKGVE
jgi:prefoldin subunit 5